MRAIFAVLIFLVTALPVAAVEPLKMTAKEAHEKALAGEIVLLDIRRPKEWLKTGVGEGAVPLTMHQPGWDLLAALEEQVGGDTDKPVALICATGGRSAWLQIQLTSVGYTQIIDVSEGMLGRPDAGSGWIKQGLPVSRPAN